MPDPTCKHSELYQRAKQLIPGGTQLLSKRPELYAPDRWPAYYREADGCEIIDVDGRRYVDMTSNGIGSCLLGYANQQVNQAVIQRVRSGSMCTLNTPDEVELAELLIELHPWAEAVRYCRTGGESMAVAVRIARAATKRQRVAFCGYHGWSDWYLAANLSSDTLDEHLLAGLSAEGVPGGLAGTVVPFRYNDPDALCETVREHGADLAAIVMEPIRGEAPQDGFLDLARELAEQSGAALVFDEISSGWRFWLGGAHLKYDVDPDIAVFAKAISNGYPMGAIVGRGSIMDAAQDTFISSTYWTDGIGPAAAMATIRQMQTINLPAILAAAGERLMQGWKRLGESQSVPARTSGQPALMHMTFDHPDHLALETLFTARMLERGYLAGSIFYPTIAHTDEVIDAFLDAANQVFPELAISIRDGSIEQRLGTPIRQTGFRRLTSSLNKEA